MTVAGDQTNAERVSAGHQSIAVELDLVNPAGADRGRSAAEGSQGSMKPAGGDRRERNIMRNWYRADASESNRLTAR